MYRSIYLNVMLNFKYIFLALFVAILLVFKMPVSFAQPKADPNAEFPVENLTLVTKSGSFQFTVEVADDANERSKGLMFREEMLLTHGMIFDFGETAPVAMWMKNTPLSLDMVFIKPDGLVAHIATNTTPFSQAIVSSREPVSHVLELNAGMANQIGLKVGDNVVHPFFATAN